MTEAHDQTNRYDAPRIEGRTAIDGPLIGGAISSNTDGASASFTHV